MCGNQQSLAPPQAKFTTPIVANMHPPRNINAPAVRVSDILTTMMPESPTGTSSHSGDWGRKTKAQLQSTAACLGLIVCCPILVVLNWVALEQYNASLSATLGAAIAQGPIPFLLRNLPMPSTTAFLAYAGWVSSQALLYALLPGPACYGQRTPGGHLLRYTANGLAAWALTHLLFLAAAVLGLVDPAYIARNWPGLLVAANSFGFGLAIFSQIKGYWFPTYAQDRKISGSWLFDLWAGVELNPRIGSFDIKFFMNGRVGMVVWTLVDLSFAAYQYERLGEVTDSMLIVLVLQTCYVVDFFCNEDWYTRTIDISHDHFGFMLAWGDSTFLPTFYTLQTQYLARNPTFLSRFQACAVLGLGFLSYAMFRSANYQRDYVRSKKGDAQIWGRKATFIECKYSTSDGKEHHTLLVTSGWWGVARHTNYLIDLVQSWAFCATCGFSNILPWSYFIFMCILLCHRAHRDERRCKIKYGDKWDDYCRVVPYRIIPGLY